MKGNPKKETFSGVRKLSQNRYAFSFEYNVNDWTLRSEYIHSTGMAFAKSITNHGDANSKDCNLNGKIGNKAQGVYALVIAPIVASKKLDAKARYDMYQANGKTDMMRTQYEAGLNYHISKNFTILTEYALINDQTLREAQLLHGRRRGLLPILRTCFYSAAITRKDARKQIYSTKNDLAEMPSRKY